MNPSDLPPEARRMLLDRLRTQIGDSQYRELTERADEAQILGAMLQQMGSQPSTSSRPSLPWWAVAIGKLLLITGLGGGAYLVGTHWWLGRALAGSALAIVYSFAFDHMPGFTIGAILGGVVGGVFGTKLDAAVGGAFIGGVALALIRVGLEWLGKQMSNLNRNNRY